MDYQTIAVYLTWNRRTGRHGGRTAERGSEAPSVRTAGEPGQSRTAGPGQSRTAGPGESRPSGQAGQRQPRPQRRRAGAEINNYKQRLLIVDQWKTFQCFITCNEISSVSELLNAIKNIKMPNKKETNLFLYRRLLFMSLTNQRNMIASDS